MADLPTLDDAIIALCYAVHKIQVPYEDITLLALEQDREEVLVKSLMDATAQARLKGNTE